MKNAYELVNILTVREQAKNPGISREHVMNFIIDRSQISRSTLTDPKRGDMRLAVAHEICEIYGTSLSEMIILERKENKGKGKMWDEQLCRLDDRQKEMLQIYNRLTPDKQALFREFLCFLTGEDRQEDKE